MQTARPKTTFGPRRRASLFSPDTASTRLKGGSQAPPNGVLNLDGYQGRQSCALCGAHRWIVRRRLSVRQGFRGWLRTAIRGGLLLHHFGSGGVPFPPTIPHCCSTHSPRRTGVNSQKTPPSHKKTGPKVARNEPSAWLMGKIAHFSPLNFSPAVLHSSTIAAAFPIHTEATASAFFWMPSPAS